MCMNHRWIKKFSQAGCVAFAVLFFCVLFPSIGLSQKTVVPMEEISASGLLDQSTALLKEQKYDQAIPYIVEYIKRMGSDKDKRVRALVQDVRFKLGKIQFFGAYSESDADFKPAIASFDEYLSRTPVYKRREALKMQAVCLFKDKQYDRCITAITNAFSNPPVVEEEEEEKLAVEKLTKAEKGGRSERQLKRYEKYAEGAEDDLATEFTSDAAAEPEFTVEELVLLNFTLGEAYSEAGQWANSITPYTYVVEHATDEGRKGVATMQMVTALIKMQRYDDAQKYVAELYRTNARYDLRVNMALMNAALALFTEERYDGALMLYRMVLPRNILMKHQLEKINKACLKAGLPLPEIKTVTNEFNRIETSFGYRTAQTNEVVVGMVTGTAMVDKPVEIDNLERDFDIIQNLPPYEDEVLFRLGLVYSKVKRPWEAVALLQVVSDHDPNGPMGRQAFYEKLVVLAFSLKEYERVEAVCKTFLAANREGVTPRQIAYVLSNVYQQQQRMKEVKDLLPTIRAFTPPTEQDAPEVKADIASYEFELYFMQAVADLILFEYARAEGAFAELQVNYPKAPRIDAVDYWHAVTLLLLQKYEEALAGFEAYLANYPSKEYVSEAMFRGGVCLFSTEKYGQAKARFTEVINNYPNSDVFADACSLRGDIYASEEGGADAALNDYRNAIKSAKKAGQAAYAVFQMAGVFEAQTPKNYPGIIDVVSAYLNKWGKDADVAKAMYWIGKTKQAQGLMDEAVAMYIDTIVKYGGEIRQDGVDSIIVSLANTTSSFKEEARKSVVSKLRDQASLSTNTVLTLRLQVLIAKMEKTEAELGARLLVEQKDLTTVPPPVIALICEASFSTKNYSRAEDILTIFKSRYEDSEFMRSAFKLRVVDLFTAGQDDEAMKLIKEAQALYGRERDMAWAQVMKGQIYLRQKDYKLAKETFEDVLKEKAWRGEPHAQAGYYLAATEEAQGNLLQAAALYQRAYMTYKGHAKGVWAAEAYMGCARCLQALGRENDRRNTLRALLFDKYVNTLPQAEIAKQELGAPEVAEIQALIASGVLTNLTVEINMVQTNTVATPEEVGK